MFLIFSDTDYTKKHMFPAFFILGIIIFIDFILPIIFHRSIKGYWNKIVVAEQKHRGTLTNRKGGIVTAVVSKLPGGAVTYFIIFFVIIGSYQGGVGSALKSSSYLATKDGKELIVKKDRESIVTAVIENGFVRQEYKLYRIPEGGKPFEFKKYNNKLTFPHLSE